MDINNKVVVVTGASFGIGRAIAQAASLAGAKVALVARSVGELNELAGKLGKDAAAFPGDASKKTDVERVMSEIDARYGRVDVLVNNAGRAITGRIEELHVDHFRQAMELNVFGVLYGMQAVIPRMRQRGGGLIVNVSSGVSRLPQPIPGYGGYAASKYAMNALSEYARVELAPENIRVMTVYPGITATDFRKNALVSNEKWRLPVPAGITPSSPEYVAQRVLRAMREEPSELRLDAVRKRPRLRNLTSVLSGLRRAMRSDGTAAR
jgi:NAD(P)-dependent dehydrogenase (short-subunit alcohol dehydrogenase family)